MSSENIIASVRQSLAKVYSAGEAAAVARMIAEECFGITMAEAYSGTARTLNSTEHTSLKYIINRLLAGEPVQYVIGHADFMGHSFHVEPNVLIPRPETEVLVHRIIADAKTNNAVRPLHIIDAGTGSGAIAISLKCALPDANVFAFDISTEALRVAQHNAMDLSAEVSFFESDMLSENLPQGPFDIIVSNPPYVRLSEATDMSIQVKEYEPHLALFVPDEDPLLYYRALAVWAQESLKSEGALYVEINSALSSETTVLFQTNGFSKVTTYKDQFNKDRVVVCRR